MPQTAFATYQIDNDKQLLELAKSLGKPIPSRRNGPLIDRLIPLPKDRAHPQSLSANFGEQAFPYHTDGAYFPVPPRYIVMRYDRGPENPTPTRLCRIDRIDQGMKDNLQFYLWKVFSFRPFYAPILSEDGCYFRFDPCIMQPISQKQNNEDRLQALLGKQTITNIAWQLNQTIVIDNWSTLHQRPGVRQDEVHYRTLQRIMII